MGVGFYHIFFTIFGVITIAPRYWQDILIKGIEVYQGCDIIKGRKEASDLCLLVRVIYTQVTRG